MSLGEISTPINFAVSQNFDSTTAKSFKSSGTPDMMTFSLRVYCSSLLSFFDSGQCSPFGDNLSLLCSHGFDLAVSRLHLGMPLEQSKCRQLASSMCRKQNDQPQRLNRVPTSVLLVGLENPPMTQPFHDGSR